MAEEYDSIKIMLRYMGLVVGTFPCSFCMHISMQLLYAHFHAASGDIPIISLLFKGSETRETNVISAQKKACSKLVPRVELINMLLLGLAAYKIL